MWSPTLCHSPDQNKWWIASSEEKRSVPYYVPEPSRDSMVRQPKSLGHRPVSLGTGSTLLGFLLFQTSLFVNIIIYWVNVWTFAKTCEIKILGHRKAHSFPLSYFFFFFSLGFYYFYTFYIVSFLKMSGGLITDKNWTVILKILPVFSQAFQWLSCIRNENPKFCPDNSTIQPYLKSISGSNSFKFDSSVHPSFVYTKTSGSSPVSIQI